MPETLLRRLVVWVLAVGATIAAGARGQDLCQGFAFDQLPVEREAQQLGANRFNILGAATLPADTSALERYYTAYLLPRLTNCNEFDNLGDIRAGVTRDFQQARSAAAHDKLADICLQFCQQILAGDYHRYSQLNAALIIASLDAYSADGGGAYVPAAQALVNALQDDAAYLEVRIAAADGLTRHAATLTPEQKSAAVEAVAGLLAAPEAPDGVDETGYQWLRSQAALLAGALGDVGPEEKVLNGLRSMLANDEVPPPLRCNAAKSLGRLDYTAAGDASLSAVTADLAQFCIDAYDHEQERTSGLGLQHVNRPAIRMYVASLVEGLVGTEEEPGGLQAAAAQGPHAANVQRIASTAQSWAEVLDEEANLTAAETNWGEIRRMYLKLKDEADNLE